MGANRNRCTDSTHERRADGRCGTCNRLRAAAWRQARPGYSAQRAREWYQNNRERALGNMREYREQNADALRVKKAEKYQRPEVAAAVAERGRQYRADIRSQVFTHYGSSCTCCGLAVPGLLTIDHIDPVTKTAASSGGDRIYRWLVKNQFPDGFQTLCYGCNLGKHGNRDLCPHQKTPELLSSASRKNFLLKEDAIKSYGRVCACCGEDNVFLLTLDHVNGDGSDHRRLLSGQGVKVPQGVQFYRHLRRREWPNDPPLRVMCGTCNRGVWRFPDGCPCGGVESRLTRISLQTAAIR